MFKLRLGVHFDHLKNHQFNDGLSGQKNKSTNHYASSGQSSSTNKKITQIIKLTPSSGGLESKDFCSIVWKSLEKYLQSEAVSYKLIEKTEFVIEVEVKAEIGFLSFAEGLMKLVRVSPFGKGDKVHTSFCNLDVFVKTEKKEVVINEKDLKWDFYKSTGPGGQHKNKTLTAARLTHIPTGIVVTSGNERSQLDNKKIALKNLEEILNNKSGNEFKSTVKQRWENNISPKDANISIYMNYQLVSCKKTNIEIKRLKDFLSGNWNLVA